MSKNLNDRLITEIIKRIPPEVKIIDYLKEILNISKESLYRRVRGELPFTFEEISRLSLELNFSVDKIIRQNTIDHMYFNIQAEESADPSKVFFLMLNKYYTDILKVLDSKDSEVIIVLNQLWPIFTLFFDPLFKFSYYKWLYSNRNHSLRYRLSEVQIPQEIHRNKE